MKRDHFSRSWQGALQQAGVTNDVAAYAAEVDRGATRHIPADCDIGRTDVWNLPPFGRRSDVANSHAFSHRGKQWRGLSTTRVMTYRHTSALLAPISSQRLNGQGATCWPISSVREEMWGFRSNT